MKIDVPSDTFQTSFALISILTHTFRMVYDIHCPIPTLYMIALQSCYFTMVRLVTACF